MERASVQPRYLESSGKPRIPRLCGRPAHQWQLIQKSERLVILAEPEPDRAAVEVREEGGVVLPVLRRLRPVPGGDRGMLGGGRREAQGRHRLTPDPQLPDL